MKATVKLLENQQDKLKNLPLFYNWIYTNPILDRGKEDAMITYSKRKMGIISYSESEKFVSKMIDFEALPQKIFEHAES